MKALNPRKRQPNVCMRCGGHDVRVEHSSDVVDFKGLTLEVAGLASTVCGNCAHMWTTDGQEQDNLDILRSAYVDKRDELRSREGLLTGEQIQRVLDQLHLSRAEAASLFGGGPNAFSKYVSGDVLQSFAMDRLLRLSMAFGDHAVRHLKRGSNTPLTKGSAGYFLAPVMSAAVRANVTVNVKSGQYVPVPVTGTPAQYSLAA